MSAGKEHIKHFEFACMCIFSSETVLIVICQCYSIMDMQVPPVPNQPKHFRFLQRTFGVSTKANKVRTHKCIRIAFRSTNLSKFSRGRPPTPPPHTRGMIPLLVLAPGRASGSRTGLPPDHFLNRGDGPDYERE